MKQEDIDKIVEDLKTGKRGLDAFTLKHPRVVWAWALIATFLFAAAWTVNKIAC
jgi:hypothetical protein